MYKNNILCFADKSINMSKNEETRKFKGSSVQVLNKANACWFLRTEELEHDSRYRQPIPYIVILSEDQKSVYCIIKHKTDESRLKNKLSFGASGHVEKQDESYSNWETIKRACKRELNEELIVDLKQKPVCKLQIKQHEGVSRFHLGFVFIGIAKNDKCRINPADKQTGTIATGEWVKINKLKNYCTEKNVKMESWAKVIYNELLKEK